MDEAIPGLSRHAFNPVVEDWSPQDKAREDIAKARAHYRLYYLTDPDTDESQASLYSYVEAVDDSNAMPDRTLVIFDTQATFPPHVQKQVDATHELLKKHSLLFDDLTSAVEWLVPRLSEPEKYAAVAVTPLTFTERRIASRAASRLMRGALRSDYGYTLMRAEHLDVRPGRQALVAERVGEIIDGRRGYRVLVNNPHSGERDASDYIEVSTHKSVPNLLKRLRIV